jgi:hypothetical protein
VLRVNHRDTTERTTFLFGVGAQKSGTTWLYAQLSKDPSVGFGWKKEISLWGSLWDKKLADRKPKRLRHRIKQQFYQFPNGRRVPHHPIFAGQLQKQYFGEFRRIAETGKQVVADVTPHYAALSANHLSLLRSWTEHHRFDPRVLFIMRDPVERVISGVMHSNRRLKNPSNEELVQLVRDTYRSYPVSVRTRYDRTIGNVESAFDAEQISFLFFEELFTDKTMVHISSWLGLSPIPADFGEKVGPGTHRVSVPEELRAKIREYYDPVYVFCESRFGSERIRSLWGNSSL